MLQDVTDIFTKEKIEFLGAIIQLVLKEKLGAEEIKKLNLKMKEGGQMLAVLDMIASENLKIRTMGIREGKTIGMREGKTIGLREGKKLGRAEGEKSGIAKGRKEKTISIAKKMKEKNANVDFIKEVTGLTEEEIEKL